MLIIGLLGSCLIYERISETRTCGDLGERRDGESCVCDAECGSDLCLTERVTGIPQGLCLRECKTSEDCSDTVCNLGWCLPPCNNNDDCEPSRICNKLFDADSCWALCSSDDDCAQGTCDGWTGDCRGLGEPEPFGQGVAGRCTEDNECKSGFCFDGGCLSSCSVQRQGCPDDAMCVRDAGDYGICFPTCDGDADCRRLGWQTCRPRRDGSGICSF